LLDPLLHPPSPTFSLAQILILGFTEVWRYNRSGGGFEGPYDPLYPGWDPAGVMTDPDQAAELKVRCCRAGSGRLLLSGRWVCCARGVLL
jgi:hypothetical protein